MEQNQCDGCRAGKPVNKDGNHVMGEGFYLDLMACQKDKYESSEQKKKEPSSKSES